MKALLVCIIMATTCLGGKLDVQEPNGEAFSTPIRVVMLEGSGYLDVLEFLRIKATDFLRDEIPSDTAIVSFEYRFDPCNDDLRAKLHRKIEYIANNVSVEEALTATLPQFGLDFQIASPTKIIIIDLAAEKEKANKSEMATPRKPSD